MMEVQDDTDNFISMIIDDDLDDSQLPDVVYWNDGFCPLDGTFLPHYHEIEWMKRIRDNSYMCVIPLMRV